jgi:hypothetical protein
MLALLRQAPGEEALVSGRFALVDHYGVPLCLTVAVEKGERLPYAAATEDGPTWFLLVDVFAKQTQAA